MRLLFGFVLRRPLLFALVIKRQKRERKRERKIRGSTLKEGRKGLFAVKTGDGTREKGCKRHAAELRAFRLVVALVDRVGDPNL